MRRHWSWPVPAGEATAASVATAREFAGSKGGYVFPVAATLPAIATPSRSGTTRSGLYKHWTWRGVDAADRPTAIDRGGDAM